MLDQNARRDKRVEVSIDVDLTHPIHSQKARIVDLSTGGAKILVTNAPKEGSKIVIDYDGHSAWASVRWAEQDRIGVVFEVPLSKGHPFHQLIGQPAPALVIPITQRSFQEVRTGFGRRAA